MPPTLRPLAIAMFSVAGLIAIAREPALRSADARPNRTGDVALSIPSRSRLLAPNHWESGRGFRDTVRHIRRWLSKTHVEYHEIPTYSVGSTVIIRFLNQSPSADWQAVHVFKTDGRTQIYLVANRP